MFSSGGGLESHLLAFALGVGLATLLGRMSAVGGDDGSKGNDDEEVVAKEGHKMILAVRTDLKMGKGKIAAQCSHATLGAYKRGLRTQPATVKFWERIGQKKITLKLSSEEEMEQIEQAAKAAGLVTHVVVDAGHTQVAPGTKTVLAIGPAAESAVNPVTAHLKLIS